MKIAKTLVILSAVVLVVVCFNAPAVFSGEAHPWDEDGDGGDNGGIGGSGEDTTIVSEDTLVVDGFYPSGGDGWFGFSDFMTIVRYVISHYGLPITTSGRDGNVAADETKGVTTSTNSTKN